MVILDDAIKIVQNGVFPFSLKKEQILVSFKKTQKNGLFQKKQKNRWVVCFLKKNRFFSTLVSLTSFAKHAREKKE